MKPVIGRGPESGFQDGASPASVPTAGVEGAPAEPQLEVRAAQVLRDVAERRALQREAFDRRRAWRGIEQRMARSAAGEHRVLAHGRFRALQVALAGKLPGPRLAFAIGAVLALSVLALWLRRDPPLTYRVEGALVANDTVATGVEPCLVVFSDRSRLSVASESEVSVRVEGAHSAYAVLKRGRVVVDVAHERNTDWTFVAGPHVVHVTGTRFALEWVPAAERFELNMYEGDVRLAGPWTQGAERVVRAGESAVWQGGQADSASGSSEAASEASATTSSDPVNPAVVEGPAVGPGPSLAEGPVQAGADEPESPPKTDAERQSKSWAAQLREGRYRLVVAEAETLGVSRSLRERSATELKALARAASYAGQPELARTAWRALRTRFAGSAVAADASFFLGRLEERGGQMGTADALYKEYLSRGGSQAYGGEALGRRMTIAERSGNLRLARRLAKQYLASHAAGAYRAAATRLAEGGS